MIVKCEQCQTRFKIPDEKVTDKGVKVRCTKCQHTFRVTRDGANSVEPTAPAAARPADADPFAKFGAGVPNIGEPTRPGVFAAGVAASKQGGGPLQPSFAAQMDQPSIAFEAPTKVAVMPPTPAGRKPLQDAAPAPFDFAAAMGGPQTTQTAQFDLGSPPGGESAAIDLATRGTEEAPAYDPFSASMTGNQAEQTAPAVAAVEPAGPPSVFGEDGGEFFDGAEASAAPAPSATAAASAEYEGREVEADTGMRAQLFEMPAAAPTQQNPAVRADGSSDQAVPLAKLNLVRVPAGGAAQSTTQPEFEAPRRKLGGLVFNVAIAASLVLLMTVIGTVYLNEGKVELASFSVDRLKATFSSNSAWATLDISNGLYDTKGGRPVFFVRGELKNRGETASKAKVRAEILDGNTSIRHADVWIGVAPSPEDLFGISVGEDVDRLLEKLGHSAAAVPAGEKRGFLVPFYEYPPDLKGFRVRVTVIEAGQGATAAR